MFTQAQLHRSLDYDPRTGLFYRTASNTRAGGVSGGCYWRICVGGTKYKASRLAWFWMLGVWPKNDVDHKDGDSLNDKWENLREATRSQNMANAKVYSNNSSGIKGVSLFRRTGKWQAYIWHEGKRIHLGYFYEKENAVRARVKAEIEYHQNFRRA